VSHPTGTPGSDGMIEQEIELMAENEDKDLSEFQKSLIEIEELIKIDAGTNDFQGSWGKGSQFLLNRLILLGWDR